PRRSAGSRPLSAPVEGAGSCRPRPLTRVYDRLHPMAVPQTSSQTPTTGTPSRPRVTALVVLAALFAGRVVAQLLQWWLSLTWLPPFDAWQSGALPYPALLAAQLAIMVAQIWVIGRVADGRFVLRPERARLLLALGLAYGALMLGRLVAGATVLDEHGWFDAPLPSCFHLVLAAFVIVTARAGRGAGP
ncbi:MAG: hypothetical protein AAFN30_15325, partial [Actinomycetota bacterium]